MGIGALTQGRGQGLLLVQVVETTGEAPPPILVTGSHRSGTTWVGRMLCASGEGAYVHEPFNPNRSPGWFPEPLPYWFMHITVDNEGPFVDAFRRMVDLRYPLGSILRSRTLRLVAMNLQQAFTATRDRLRGRRLVLKDPMALYSAEWLAQRFGMLPVILIRHPASFVASIKRLGWGFDYERNWLEQPLLMRNLLGRYEDDFRGYRGEADLVEEGMVVWKAAYDVVAGYRDRHPGWALLRYEDVSSDPVTAFRGLYRGLGLRWTDRVEETIARYSSDENPRDVPPRRKHEIRRDSRAASKAWRERLSPEEIERVRRGTEGIWRRFYGEDEW